MALPQPNPVLDKGIATLVDLLRFRAEENLFERAYVFLEDGEKDEKIMSYADLDRRARAIAAQLQELGVMPGDRAVLLYPPGLEYVAGFFGCLYAGVIAVPAYPPNPMRLDRTLPRLQAIVGNAGASIALTTEPILQMAPFVFAQAPDLAAMQWLATDTIEDENAAGWRRPDVSADSLAFLQYTSGSTQTPRGVMLSHANLLHNLELIRQAFELVTAEDIGIIWLPPYHDMGLIGGLLEPIYNLMRVVLISPIAFLQRPVRWVQAISKYHATVSGGPNFAYDLVARKITPEQLAELDLSAWSMAFNGAEPVRPATLDRFVEVFGPVGFKREAFYPTYGLAEATLIATGGRRAEPPILREFSEHILSGEASDNGNRVTLVGCGVSLGDQKTLIVAPDARTLMPDGQVGELWLQGGSVARGYWDNAEATQATFQGFTADGDGPFLRTGDLALRDSDGQFFIAGRIKDLIIIDGRNHYPQDIEFTVELVHPAIRPGCTAAFSVDSDAGEQLVIVTEIRKQYKPSVDVDDPHAIDPEALRERIRKAVSEKHELRVHDVIFLAAGEIPKTSSGKIQRYAARKGYLAGALNTWD
jgi:acyl-CoA synthetase (AMP-forming)/AMP-acid ligase II